MWVGVAINMKITFNIVNYSLDQAALVFTPREYVVGQLCSRTRHRMLAVAALDKSLSMVL